MTDLTKTVEALVVSKDRQMRVIQLLTQNVGLLSEKLEDQNQRIKELNQAVAKLILERNGAGVPPHVANRVHKPEVFPEHDEPEHEHSDPEYVWGFNGFPAPLDTFTKVMDSLRQRGAVTPESVSRVFEADLEQRIKRVRDILSQLDELKKL